MNVDSQAIQSTIGAHLPAEVRWELGGSSLKFDFFGARKGLRRLSNADVVGCKIPGEWSGFLVFGNYDYAEGGGASAWMGVREADGAVCGLDIEREEEPTFLFNSSIDRFIGAFSMLDQFLHAGRRLPWDIAVRVRDIDPEAFPICEWRWLIEHINANQPDTQNRS